MRVLHFQHNGVGVILSAAMNRLGVDSLVLATAPHPFGFHEDALLPHRTGLARPLRALDWRKYFDYDVFHDHDTRIPRTARAHWTGRIIQHYHDPKTVRPVEGASMAFVSLPGIRKVIPDGIWIPLPVFSDVYTPSLRPRRDVVRVGYCAQTADPTKPQLIPVAETLEAVARCGAKAEAYPLEGLWNHADMIDYYKEIDIWVDRVGCDFYGFSTVEVASMGIPVVTQIGEYEREFVADCPFVSVDRTGVTRALVELIEDAALRGDLGLRSREFVIEYHDAMRVAGLCIEHYKRLLKGN
jgi:hypothetical protein